MQNRPNMRPQIWSNEQTDSFFCRICSAEYDFDEHAPRIFSQSGHSLSSSCIEDLIDQLNEENTSLVCPLDKKPISGKIVKDFPKNFLALEVLEKKQPKEMCKDHSEPLILICFTDSKKLCPICISQQDHHQHQIRTIKEIKKGIETYKAKAEAFIKEMGRNKKRIDKDLHMLKASTKNKIRKEFDIVQIAISMKEQAAFFELECVLCLEKQRVEEAIGENNIFKKDMEHKLATMLNDKGLFQIKDLFSGIQELIDQYKSKVTDRVFDDQVKKVIDWCEEVLCSFKKRIHDYTKDLSFLGDILTDKRPPLLFTGDMAEVYCPLDKIRTSRTYIQDFPKNVLALEALEKKEPKEMCKSHSEEVILVCLTDGKKLCPTCISEQDHHQHPLRTIKLIKEDIVTYKAKAEAFIKEMQKNKKRMDEALDMLKDSTKNKIKQEFSVVRKAISMKEHVAFFELECVFDLEKQRVEEAIGKNNIFKKDMEHKLATMLNDKGLFQIEDLFSGIQGLINQYTSKVTDRTFDDHVKKIRDWCEKVLYSYKTTIRGYVKDLSLFEGILINKSAPLLFAEDLAKFFSLSLKPSESPFFSFDLGGSFGAFHSESLLKIRDKFWKKEKSNIKFSKLKNVGAISLQMSSNNYSEIDDFLLSYFWPKPVNPQKLSIKFSNKIPQFVRNVILGETRSFSELAVDFSKFYSEKKDKVAKFLQILIPKMQSLKKFRIALVDSNVTVETFKTIKTLVTKDITEIEMNFYKTNIHSEDLDDDFFVLPNLKKFNLNLSLVKIQDVNGFFNKRLCSMENLEELKLCFNLSKISDFAFDSSLLKNLKILHLHLSQTQITDSSFVYLAQMINNCSNIMEDLIIKFEQGTVTDTGVYRIFVKMPNLKRFKINLANTEITDVSIKALTQNMLPYLDNLEDFEINVFSTKVTDESFTNMLMSLKKVRKLSLGFDNIKIRCLEEFINKKVSVMKEFKHLRIFSKLTVENQYELKYLIKQFKSVRVTFEQYQILY